MRLQRPQWTAVLLRTISSLSLCSIAAAMVLYGSLRVRVRCPNPWRRRRRIAAGAAEPRREAPSPPPAASGGERREGGRRSGGGEGTSVIGQRRRRTRTGRRAPTSATARTRRRTETGGERHSDPTARLCAGHSGVHRSVERGSDNSSTVVADVIVSIRFVSARPEPTVPSQRIGACSATFKTDQPHARINQRETTNSRHADGQ